MVRTVVDKFIEPNIVLGCVHDDDNGLDIFVEKQGRIIGIGVNNTHRGDLISGGWGACAYNIETTENFSYYDVFVRTIKVFFLKDGKKIEIEISD